VNVTLRPEALCASFVANHDVMKICVRILSNNS